MNAKNLLKVTCISATLIAFTASASFAGCGCGKKTKRTTKSSVSMQAVVR